MKGRWAQTSLEYAMFIICFILALLAMQNYIKRGMQGRLRRIVDEIGEQYAPQNTTGSFNFTYKSSSLAISGRFSEQQLNTGVYFYIDTNGDGKPEEYKYQCYPPCDLNNDGDIIDTDVFGNLNLNFEIQNTTQKGNETVKNLK
jgi:hypothetical protein